MVDYGKELVKGVSQAWCEIDLEYHIPSKVQRLKK